MGSEHLYLHGGTLACLAPEDVDDAVTWKKTPRALDLLNLSFQMYYDACNATGYDEMQRSLDQAARYWYFLYSAPPLVPGSVRTLEDAFKHLDKNDGRWTNSDTGNYAGGGVGGAGYTPDIPSAAANFLKAIDQDVDKLHDYFDSISEGLGHIHENRKADDDDTNWEKVGKGLEMVEKYSKYAKPLLWLAPKALQEGAEVLEKWEGITSTIYGKMDYIMKIAASNNPAQNLMFDAFIKAIEYAPVLGPFYGRIVAEIPGMAAHWEEFCDDYWGRMGGETFRHSLGLGHMFSPR